MIKTVFIDVDNTLLDFRKCSRASIAKCLVVHDIECTEHFLQVFERRNNALWLDIEEGRYTVQQLRRERWNMIFAELGIGLDGVAFEEEFRKELKQSAEPVDGAVQLLEYLAGKYRICVASNASFEQQECRLKKAGMLQYIDRLFTSEEIGVLKPERGFFEACFAQLGDVKPEDCMMIGDSLPADIRGAAAMGMKTCWFNYTGADTESQESDFTVNSLREIMEIL